MSTSVAADQVGQSVPPRSMARLAGLFYLLTFATGLIAWLVRDKLGSAAGMVAGGSYVVVTLLFYHLFKPVNRMLSLIAACISLAGCAIGPIGLFVHGFSQVNPLVVFGFYCLLIGYLIWNSTFLPPVLGLLMVFAGMGWLTFFSRALAARLALFSFLPGLIGEGALTMWLLVAGVNEARWREQSSRSLTS